MSKNVVLMEFEHNPNIGLYMFVNDKVCILGKKVSETKKKEIEKVLDVPVEYVTVLETDLVGIFIAGDNDYLILPELFDYEMKRFEELCTQYEMQMITLKHRLNTLGNNTCFGKNVILINDEYPETVKNKLNKETGYDIVEISKEEYRSVGGVCAFGNGKFFVSQEFEEEEVKDILDQIGGVGTVNSGGNFVASGIVGNSKGLILGSQCSTVEIQNVVESLDYL